MTSSPKGRIFNVEAIAVSQSRKLELAKLWGSFGQPSTNDFFENELSTSQPRYQISKVERCFWFREYDTSDAPVINSVSHQAQQRLQQRMFRVISSSVGVSMIILTHPPSIELTLWPRCSTFYRALETWAFEAPCGLRIYQTSFVCSTEQPNIPVFVHVSLMIFLYSCPLTP